MKQRNIRQREYLYSMAAEEHRCKGREEKPSSQAERDNGLLQSRSTEPQCLRAVLRNIFKYPEYQLIARCCDRASWGGSRRTAVEGRETRQALQGGAGVAVVRVRGSIGALLFSGDTKYLGNAKGRVRKRVE